MKILPLEAFVGLLAIPEAFSLRGGGGLESSASGGVRIYYRNLLSAFGFKCWWDECSDATTLQASLSNPVAEDPTDCENNVCGTVTFSYPMTNNGLTQVDYSITGLAPGLHALHVHEAPVGTGGDISCSSTGGHWNPEENNHGNNLDAQRHIGDLGNILAGEDGLAEGTLLARVPLNGSLSIAGLAVVVHEGTDDLGLGGDAGSRAVGNAGARPGCGTIN